MKGLELNIHNKHSSLGQSLATEANGQPRLTWAYIIHLCSILNFN